MSLSHYAAQVLRLTAMHRLALADFPSDAQLDAAEELFLRLARFGLPWELEQIIREYLWLGPFLRL